MGEHRAVNKLISDSCTRRAMTCTCGFLYREDGNEKAATGTLVEHDGQKLILTCYHVARPILADQKSEIFFGPNNLHVYPRQLEVVESDSKQDIALLRITSGPLSREHCGLSPRTIDEFERVHDLRTVARDDRDGFVLVGMPAELVLTPGEQRLFRPLTYTTVQHPDRPSEMDCLILDYPYTNKDPSDPLPDAGGMSGSLVLRLPPAEPGELWSVGGIVAILTHGDKKGTYVRCRALTVLHDWLAR